MRVGIAFLSSSPVRVCFPSGLLVLSVLRMAKTFFCYSLLGIARHMGIILVDSFLEAFTGL
jgi:hypothetical protein